MALDDPEGERRAALDRPLAPAQDCITNPAEQH
jgi:hypothetical protein